MAVRFGSFYPNFEREPLGGLRASSHSPSSNLTKVTCGLSAIGIVPHAEKALCIYRNPCIIWDSNSGPNAQQSESLSTLPDGWHQVDLLDCNLILRFQHHVQCLGISSSP
ncbi:hypothetical protein TNCV_2936071 [Trichonephila clavipes]|nr:hypothetical protein TNCV_2936071 [Trichonephila clavipes]